MKKTIYTLVKIAIGFIIFIVLPLGGMASCVTYLNWSAEREARALCDSIPLNSAIIPVIAQFNKNIGFVKEPGGKETVRHYGFPDWPYTDGHRFMFMGAMLDKAYCNVSLSQDGKVVSKNSFLLED